MEGHNKAESASGQWSHERVELIKRTICPKGIGEDEFALFIE
ncbi:MAG TPA: phage recombination protein Bet, partial [Myxococcaceae bacterium]|nr:phage recombination protein Bet [Myxococcaceae bacterium]